MFPNCLLSTQLFGNTIISPSLYKNKLEQDFFSLSNLNQTGNDIISSLARYNTAIPSDDNHFLSNRDISDSFQVAETEH